jgi:hypothetical protein
MFLTMNKMNVFQVAVRYILAVTQRPAINCQPKELRFSDDEFWHIVLQ